MDNGDISIVYIAGYGRSGSTLMDIILSDHSSIEGLGELVNVFDYWNSGEVSDFWTRIKERYQSKTLIIGDEGKVLRSVESIFSSAIFFPRLKINILQRYTKIISSLFTAIQEETGKLVFVDSSKTAWTTFWRPYFLSRTGFDLYIVHMVRDGEDVFDSMKKLDNLKAEKNLRNTSMKFPLLRSVLGWNLANLSARINSRLAANSYYLLEYEKLIRSPSFELKNIFVNLDLNCDEILLKILNKKGFSSRHQFSGNRMRKEKNITIKEWIDKPCRKFSFKRWLFFV